MTNLTKLFCDLISTGCTINEADAPQIAQHVAGLAHHMLPNGFWIDVDHLEEHIYNLQICRREADRKMVEDARGADNDINDGTELPFNVKEVSRY